MTASPLVLAILAIAALLGSAPLPAQSLTRWPSMRPGSVRFETTTEFTQRTVVGKSEDRTHTLIHALETYDVLEVAADGSAVFRLSRGRIWGQVTDRQGTHAFDTAKDDDPPRAAEIWIELLSKTEEYRIDPQGLLLSIRTVQADGSLGEPDEHAVDSMQCGFVQRPDLPLQVGATWTPAVGIHECTPTGCMHFDTTNTLRAITDDSLTIATRAEPPPADAKTLDASVSREVILSRRDGLPIQLEIAGSQSHRGRGTLSTVEISLRSERLKASPTRSPPTTSETSGRSEADFDAAWRTVAARFHELSKAQGMVGSSLAFVHGDRVLAQEFQGHADLESDRPVDAHTIYHWASITKTFTGIAILQLRDRGRLKLDEALVDFLPSFRGVHNPFGSMRDITLRHLLTHTSGFRGATWPWSKGEEWHPHEPTEWSQLVAMIPYTEIEFPPGSKFSYSNPGIVFLGRVIELLSGDDYEVYVEKNILRPLGMRSAYFDHTPYHLLEHRSNNYRIVGGEPVAGSLDFDTGITVSNGGLNASVDDMQLYLRFLAGHPASDDARAVLSGESLAEMRRPHPLNDGSPSGMGLTWFLHGANGLVGHTGGQKSFSSFIDFDPATGAGCIAAFNTSGGRGVQSAFGETRRLLFDTVFPLFAAHGDEAEASRGR